MQAVKGKRMNKARMQMDWLRYWTLQAPNERSTKAPATKRTTYTLACVGPERAAERSQLGFGRARPTSSTTRSSPTSSPRCATRTPTRRRSAAWPTSW